MTATTQTLFGHEITRQIWTDIDNLVLVYVGSAAEFPLVPENDWLFYTGKLPAQPMDRFIDTIRVNHRIFTSPRDEIRALAVQIRDVHRTLEQRRSSEEGARRVISNAAFKQVGAMLIDYGIRGYEYLHRRPLSDGEKEMYYADEREFLTMMEIEDVEPDYAAFSASRARMLSDVYARNELTDRFFDAYRQSLGSFRYGILTRVMACLVPDPIREKAGLRRSLAWEVAYRLYPALRCALTTWVTRKLLLTPSVRGVLHDLEQANRALTM